MCWQQGGKQICNAKHGPGCVKGALLRHRCYCGCHRCASCAYTHWKSCEIETCRKSDVSVHGCGTGKGSATARGVVAWKALSRWCLWRLAALLLQLPPPPVWRLHVHSGSGANRGMGGQCCKSGRRNGEMYCGPECVLRIPPKGHCSATAAIVAAAGAAATCGVYAVRGDMYECVAWTCMSGLMQNVCAYVTQTGNCGRQFSTGPCSATAAIGVDGVAYARLRIEPCSLRTQTSPGTAMTDSACETAANPLPIARLILATDAL